MSYGFVCSACGWQEGEHKDPEQAGAQRNVVLPRYQISLAQCPGYSRSEEEKRYRAQRETAFAARGG